MALDLSKLTSAVEKVAALAQSHANLATTAASVTSAEKDAQAQIDAVVNALEAALAQSSPLTPAGAIGLAAVAAAVVDTFVPAAAPVVDAAVAVAPEVVGAVEVAKADAPSVIKAVEHAAAVIKEDVVKAVKAVEHFVAPAPAPAPTAVAPAPAPQVGAPGLHATPSLGGLSK